MDGLESDRPLYMQARDELERRLVDGRWPPGMLLPSEHKLAAQLGVSQGTIRKALDGLVNDGLLLRRQGRGTFVSSQEEGHFLFKFFRMRGDNGERDLPSSVIHGCALAAADATTARILHIGPRSRIWLIERLRSISNRPAILERIMLPAAKFPDLNRYEPLPNNIYAFFASRFGVTIRRATEEVKAVTATQEDCDRLHCPASSALLRIDRTAIAVDGTPVERRISLCRTDDLHYEVLLT